MLCKSLNIPLCFVCNWAQNHDVSKLYQSKCWIEWWKYEFDLKHQSEIKNYIKSVIRTEGFEYNFYSLYLKEAIKLYYPQYYDWLEKVIILI
jgi:hypothetical protein